MAEHVWSVLCQKASIDKDTNIVSLLTVVEALTLQDAETKVAELETMRAQMEAGKEILVPTDFILISWIVRTDNVQPETASYRVSIDPPEGKLPQKFEQTADLSSHNGMRMRHGYDHIPFRGLGTYWFVVELKKGNRWMKVARIPLTLNASPIEPEQPS